MTGSNVERDALEEKEEKTQKTSQRKKAGTNLPKSLLYVTGLAVRQRKEKRWVDCNAPDGKGGYKSCGRSSGEKKEISCVAGLLLVLVKSEERESRGEKGFKKKKEKRSHVFNTRFYRYAYK